MFKKLKKERAFTLAEVLITLIIIGVVAVLTVPALIDSISDKILENQRKTAGAKIAEGFSQMRAEGLLGIQYANTTEFVNAMQKHFKIANVCDKDNLTKCFASSITSGEDKYEIPTNLEDAENTVGIKFADGVDMLIKYNPEGSKINLGDKGADGKLGVFDKTKNYADFGNLFTYVFDVNHTDGPNILGSDIIGNLDITKGGSFNLGFEIIGPQIYTVNIDFVGGNDSLVSATSFCQDKGGKLPTRAQLDAIADAIYGSGYTKTEVISPYAAGWDDYTLKVGTPQYNGLNPELARLVIGKGRFISNERCVDQWGNRLIYSRYYDMDGSGWDRTIPDIDSPVVMCVK